MLNLKSKKELKQCHCRGNENLITSTSVISHLMGNPATRNSNCWIPDQVGYDRGAESGRSMVEMLGVLAVIGVLSAVAVLGLKQAFIKHNANTLLNEANKRAVTVAGQIGFGLGAPTLTEFTQNTFADATFETQVVCDGLSGQFGIKLTNVEQQVCAQMLQAIDETTPLRRLSKEDSKTTSITACDDTADLILVYNDDLSGATGEPAYCKDVSECASLHATCTDGVCKEPTLGACDPALTNPCADECLICNPSTLTCETACTPKSYLQSDGGQWIDTKYIPKASTKVELRAEYSHTSNSYLFGSMNTDYKTNVYSFSGNNTTSSTYFRVFVSGDTPLPSTFGNIVNGFHTTPTLSFLEMTNSYANVDGVIYNYDEITTKNLNIAHPLFLFARNNKGTADVLTTMKVYAFRIWDDDTLVRDFIPVRYNPTNEACMYDKVSKQLFCNQGSGSFTTD